jgi:hypothetical protein
MAGEWDTSIRACLPMAWHRRSRHCRGGKPLRGCTAGHPPSIWWTLIRSWRVPSSHPEGPELRPAHERITFPVPCGNRDHAGRAEGPHAGVGPSRGPANAAGDALNAAIARCNDGWGCSAHLPTLPMDAIRLRVTRNVALASQGASLRWPTLSPPVSQPKACLPLIPHMSVARNMWSIRKASGNKFSLVQCMKAPIDRRKQSSRTSRRSGRINGVQ